MRTHGHAAAPRAVLCTVAREPESPWEARSFADVVPPAGLLEARTRRDELAALLGRERSAAADFLLALADFDRRRAWARLGHASLFAFLTRELGLSAGAAQLRLSAARLLPKHAAVEAALRSGRLCLSAVGQLARVVTPANEAEVLPRFLGLSAREAQEVAAAILPAPCPPRREVVTALPSAHGLWLGGSAASGAGAVDAAEAPPAAGARTEAHGSTEPPDALAGGSIELGGSGPAGPASAAAVSAGAVLALGPLHTHEVPGPGRVAPRTADVEPLTADLRRLHLTVSKGFLEKVAEARIGLSHARPAATTEQVLEAALDLLLERQARQRAQVRRPRSGSASSTVQADLADRRSEPEPAPMGPPAPVLTGTRPPARRPHVPAEVERAVRLRDRGRCQHPLDAGGVCGSRWQVELDHVLPLARGGATEAANLRCLCRRHHVEVTELELGAPVARTVRRP